MRRREFITLVGGAATWPVVATGQRAPLPLIGWMHGGKAEDNTEEVAAFEEGLKRSGFTAGQSVSIEYRWAAGRYERLRSIAKEFVERPVTLILAGTPVAAIAAKSESTVVPIVFHIGSDPVRDGLVASLNRPGGNVTGSTFFSNLLTSKRMGLFRELLPQARSIAVLVNPKNANAAFQVSEAQEAARALRLEAIVHRAATSDDIDAVFNTLREQKPDAMLILSDSILNGLAAPIAYAALRNGLPTCFAYREPVLAGGLIGYGANRSESTLRAGVYAGRILKGEKPADLPVQQPTRFDFIINLRTARALGITVPPTLLARADEVIE